MKYLLWDKLQERVLLVLDIIHATEYKSYFTYALKMYTYLLRSNYILKSIVKLLFLNKRINDNSNRSNFLKSSETE